MNKLMIILLAGFVLFSCQLRESVRMSEGVRTQHETGNAAEIAAVKAKLLALPGVQSVEEVAYDTTQFKAAWAIMFEQELLHGDPSKGHFTQKFYLNHKGFDAPMVFNINGYSVPSNGFVSELAPWLDANFIHVEHRYFGESVPESMDYSYLTIEQAAKDHHQIIESLKALYKGNWISTGISKGGQASIFHRSFFPGDVDVTIPYVAPVNLAQEDQRLIDFLDQVGTPECRKAVLDYQRDLLTNYDSSLEAFKTRIAEQKIEFPMSLERAFELSVLEFEFAYWQWTGGENCELIPGHDAGTSDRIEYLFQIDAPGFFTTASIDYFFPFFYQAYAELGMYGYSVDSLEGYLREYKSYVNNYHTFIPEDMSVEYHPETLQKVNRFLLEEGNHFIYIYGENDAWSATAFHPDTKKTDAIAIFKKDGSHFTRINNLSEKQKELVFEKLEQWLGQDLDVE